MCGDERAVDDLVTEMLWSRRTATLLCRVVWIGWFTHRAAVVAVIAHHDLEHPDAPARGPGRVLSILQHTMDLAHDVRAHPARYTAAAGINARRLDQIDPQLLRHARNVLAALPGLVTDATNDLEHYLNTADDRQPRRIWAGSPAAVGSEPQGPGSRTTRGMATHHEQSHAKPATG